MKKSPILLGLALSFLILAVSLTSASSCYSYDCNDYPVYSNNYPVYSNSYSNYYSNAYPTYSESASANSGSNSQYYNYGPIASKNTYSGSKSASSNFDSSDYGFAYQGPIASTAVVYDEYLQIKPNGKITRIISYSDKTNYAGEKALETANSQNRRTSSSEAVKTTSDNSWQGYTWSTKEAFDNSKYAKDSGWDQFYYQPTFSNGYYNWDY